MTSSASPPPQRRIRASDGWIRATLTFVVVFVLWELAYRLLRLPAYILPGPSKIGEDFIGQAGRIFTHAFFTGQIIIAGYVVAVLVSIPLALLIAYSRFVETTLYPLLVVFQIIPKIAIAPLFIIWFGFGYTPKLLIVFLLSFFPIVVSSIAGFKAVDPEIADFARTTGASGWKLFAKIRLPQALPDIFTGMKVGAALSATAAIVAEFVASDSGLGYLLLQYNGNLDTPMVFAVIFLLSFIGLAVYYTVEFIERITIPWHTSQNQVNTTSM